MTKDKAAEAAPIIDLGDLDTGVASDKGARVELRHPTTNAKLGIFITVLGKHSQIFREAVKDRVNAAIRKESVAGRRNKFIEPKTAEEVEREALELLTICTLGWETEIRTKVEGQPDKIEVKPILTFKGQELPFNAGNALTVYSSLLWVSDQVDEAIGDLENFI